MKDNSVGAILVQYGNTHYLFGKFDHLSHIDAKAAIADSRLELIEQGEPVRICQSWDVVVGYAVNLWWEILNDIWPIQSIILTLSASWVSSV